MTAVETFSSILEIILEMFCDLNANAHIRLLILASIGLLSQLHYYIVQSNCRSSQQINLAILCLIPFGKMANRGNLVWGSITK